MNRQGYNLDASLLAGRGATYQFSDEFRGQSAEFEYTKMKEASSGSQKEEPKVTVRLGHYMSHELSLQPSISFTLPFPIGRF